MKNKFSFLKRLSDSLSVCFSRIIASMNRSERESRNAFINTRSRNVNIIFFFSNMHYICIIREVYTVQTEWITDRRRNIVWICSFSIPISMFLLLFLISHSSHIKCHLLTYLFGRTYYLTALFSLKQRYMYDVCLV